MYLYMSISVVRSPSLLQGFVPVTKKRGTVAQLAAVKLDAS